MRKLAVSLSKGGVGKTTTSVSLASGLAVTGKRVLLVDTDTQGQCASMLGVSPKRNLVDLVDEAVKPNEVITSARDNLDLIAGGTSLAGLKRSISRLEIGGERAISKALSPFNNRYDYVIIDTSPGWDSITINVLFYASEILTPVSLEVMTLDSMLTFLDSMNSVKEYNPKLELRYVLPTFLDRRVKKSSEILDQLKSHFGDVVCEPIRYNVRLSEAPGHGQTIYEHDPSSNGALDYAKLVERVLADD